MNGPRPSLERVSEHPLTTSGQRHVPWDFSANEALPAITISPALEFEDAPSDAFHIGVRLEAAFFSGQLEGPRTIHVTGSWDCWPDIPTDGSGSAGGRSCMCDQERRPSVSPSEVTGVGCPEKQPRVDGGPHVSDADHEEGADSSGAARKLSAPPRRRVRERVRRAAEHRLEHRLCRNVDWHHRYHAGLFGADARAAL